MKAQVIELNDTQAAPYESGSMLLSPLNIDFKMAQFTAVHQLTHAASYSPRPWIQEGVAHFAQAVYRERESGREAALDFLACIGRRSPKQKKRWLTRDRTRARLLRSANSLDANSLTNTSIEEFYRSKAMYVWWMLRDMVGDDAIKQTWPPIVPTMTPRRPTCSI